MEFIRTFRRDLAAVLSRSADRQRAGWMVEEAKWHNEFEAPLMGTTRERRDLGVAIADFKQALAGTIAPTR